MNSTPTEFWEQRYADSERVWSGRVNPVLADVAAGLVPGRSLDLGCGEGGDVVWLARNGWQATGVDLSATAVSRARQSAQERGLAERTTFVAADLAAWTPDDEYDLVSASFLQSWPVAIPREQILRRATGFVAPGGVLLVVGHASPPPWARHDHAGHGDHDGQTFPAPDTDLAALGLDQTHWEVLACEVRERRASGPDGTTAALNDSVVLVRRRRVDET